jgi:hypothetical protein
MEQNEAQKSIGAKHQEESVVMVPATTPDSGSGGSAVNPQISFIHCSIFKGFNVKVLSLTMCTFW